MKKHPFLAILLIVLLLLLLAFIITGIVIMTFARGTAGEFQYLVVLGTTVNGTQPSSMLQDRINAAYDYLTAHPDVVCIVSGGKGDAHNLSEAQCMYNELTKLGIPAERIWLEDQATSTLENLEFSLKLIKEKTDTRPDCIGLLSSEFHLLRANMFAKAQNVSAVTIPAKTTDTGTFISYFLREIVLVWYYAILG